MTGLSSTSHLMLIELLHILGAMSLVRIIFYEIAEIEFAYGVVNQLPGNTKRACSKIFFRFKFER